MEKLQSFLKDHPLYKTHKIHFDERKKTVVPNFVNDSLPRCDRGDREYYCATMLTLFKPWRSGKDLKDENYSWDETFNDHEFTARQLEMLKYFNIRYECNNARDDYSAQLKKGDASGGIFPWISSETLDDLDDIDSNDQGRDFGDDDHDNEEYGTNKYAGLGKTGNLIKMKWMLQRLVSKRLDGLMIHQMVLMKLTKNLYSLLFQSLAMDGKLQ
jgi:hypothetical protein